MRFDDDDEYDDALVGARLANVLLFAITLVGLGVGLGLALGHAYANRSDAPELARDENRALAGFPAPSWAALRSGEFAEGVDAWIADHFPRRERLLDLHFWLEQHRGLAAAPDEVAVYAVEIDLDADLEPFDDEASLDDLDDLELLVEADPFAGGEAATDSADAGESPADEGEVTRSPGILVHAGRAMQLFAGGPKGSRHYAAALNAYAEALAGEVRVYSLIVPTAQTFYLPAGYEGRIRHEPPNITATYAMLDPRIKSVDVVEALRGHVDEPIYFRTDHHWTGRAAYYAYVAFCEAAGLEPVPLAAMSARSTGPFRGSLYGYTRDEHLRGKPDQVEYFVPPGEFTVERYASVTQRHPHEGVLLREQSKDYGVFLGGDHPILVVRTAHRTGRRALLVKNSYGNPFGVYLVGNFDEVVIVDYRKFDGSILAMVEAHGITDLIFLNGAITANARFHIARLARILRGADTRKRRR